jgi:hypothetical protein
MVEKIIHKVLAHRHFWRDISFNELSELYASMLLRTLALSLIGLFIPIYLYLQGYSVRDVFLYYFILYAVRALLDICSAFIVGRIGPKHTIGLSTVVSIVHLVMLLTLKELGWPLPVLALLNAAAASLFFVAFHTDFSKIKDSKHGGKEIGYMTMIEKLGGVLGPLVGGALATFLDARYTIIVAISVLLVSLVPLLMTNEVVKVHQHITFRGFPWRSQTKQLISYSCNNTENIICLLLWNFYLALVVFKTGTYAKIGAITALTTALSFFFARYIGKHVDSKNGQKLLRVGVVSNSLVHVMRLFVGAPLAAFGVNAINEPITMCYRMPYAKNYYDTADTLPGYRIAFIALNEATSAFTRSLLWLTLLIASYHVSEITAIKGAFIAAAFLSLGIAMQPKPRNNHKQ